MITTIKGTTTIDQNGNKVVKVNVSKKNKLTILQRIIRFVKNLFK